MQLPNERTYQMFKRMSLGTALIASLIFISGCATTGRNYQSDIDSLNSRITSLQAQLSEKDQQISKLQNQLGDQQSALNRAESQKAELSEQLTFLTSKEESDAKRAGNTRLAEKKPAAPSKPEQSDLK